MNEVWICFGYSRQILNRSSRRVVKWRFTCWSWSNKANLLRLVVPMLSVRELIISKNVSSLILNMDIIRSQELAYMLSCLANYSPSCGNVQLRLDTAAQMTPDDNFEEKIRCRKVVYPTFFFKQTAGKSSLFCSIYSTAEAGQNAQELNVKDLANLATENELIGELEGSSTVQHISCDSICNAFFGKAVATIVNSGTWIIQQSLARQFVSISYGFYI